MDLGARLLVVEKIVSLVPARSLSPAIRSSNGQYCHLISQYVVWTNDNLFLRHTYAEDVIGISAAGQAPSNVQFKHKHMPIPSMTSRTNSTVLRTANISRRNKRFLPPPQHPDPAELLFAGFFPDG